MAEVTQYKRRITPEVAPTPRFDTSAGRAMNVDVTKVSDPIVRGARDLATGVLSLAEQKEEAMISQKINDFSADMQNYLSNPDTGVLRTQAENAAGITEAAGIYAMKRRDEIGKDLSRRSLELYNRAVQGQVNSLRNRTSEHESTQMDKWRDNEFKKTVQNSTNTIASAPYDANVYLSSMDTLRAETESRWAGRPQEEIDRIYKEAATTILGGVLQRIITQDPAKARGFLELHKNEVSKEEYNLMKDYAETNLLTYDAQQWAATFVDVNGHRSGMEKAYAEIETLPEWKRKSYRDEWARAVDVAQKQEQQTVYARTELATNAMYSGDYTVAQAKQIVKESAKWLYDNGYSQQGHNLEVQLDKLLKPPTAPALSEYAIAAARSQFQADFENGLFDRTEGHTVVDKALNYYRKQGYVDVGPPGNMVRLPMDKLFSELYAGGTSFLAGQNKDTAPKVLRNKDGQYRQILTGYDIEDVGQQNDWINAFKNSKEYKEGDFPDDNSVRRAFSAFTVKKKSLQIGSAAPTWYERKVLGYEADKPVHRGMVGVPLGDVERLRQQGWQAEDDGLLYQIDPDTGDYLLDKDDNYIVKFYNPKDPLRTKGPKIGATGKVKDVRLAAETRELMESENPPYLDDWESEELLRRFGQ